MTELVLGTAQWGAGYGVTNLIGRLGDAQIDAIAAVAQEAGIAAVDTAAGYGDAQRRLRPWSHAFAVRTKLSGAEPTELASGVDEALAELDVARLDGCLIHDWDALDPRTATKGAGELERLRDRGLARCVGVSVYDEAALGLARDAFEHLDMVQVPANALDRRLDASSLLGALADSGTIIQVRSAFLQGLLAGPSGVALGQHPHVLRFLAAASDSGHSALAMALAHVRALPWASEIVIGVASADELTQILSAWSATVPALLPDDLASDDLSLIDPRTWGNATASVRMGP